MTEFESLTIVLGAVTETDSLTETVRFILSACNHSDLKEILIICSQNITEHSREAVESILNNQADVPVIAITQTEPGIAGGIRCGIENASGTHCIFLSSDFAEDLEILPVMIEKVKQSPSRIVSASRWLKGQKFYGYGRFKKLLNFCAQIFLKVLFISPLTDFTNPVQIAPSELYKSLSLESTGFSILLELVLKPLKLGYEFEEVPSNCYSRKQGKSNNSYAQLPSYLHTALRTRFMKKEDMLKKDSALYKEYFEKKQ